MRSPSAPRSPGSSRGPADLLEPTELVEPTDLFEPEDVLEEVSARLGSVREARWMLERVIGCDAAKFLFLSGADRRLTPGDVAEVEAMVERRLAGEPLQYVLGTWAFRRLEVQVDHRVLIPRPETEEVVGFALEVLQEAAGTIGPGTPAGTLVPRPPVVAVDLGTGSGVIALSVASECALEGGRGIEVWATDDSADALAVALVNLGLLAKVDPDAAAAVRLSEGSLFDALPADLMGGVHLIVSNPPYVSASEWEGLDPLVRDHEPRHALVSGETGLEVLELIVADAASWLAPGGALVLELAPHQSGSIAAVASSAGFVEVEVRPDLAGRARSLVARKSDA